MTSHDLEAAVFAAAMESIEHRNRARAAEERAARTELYIGLAAIACLGLMATIPVVLLVWDLTP